MQRVSAVALHDPCFGYYIYFFDRPYIHVDLFFEERKFLTFALLAPLFPQLHRMTSLSLYIYTDL